VAFGDVATYEITAGGNDIWGTQDQGRYVYQSRAGDFDARVKVDSLSIPANGESPSIAKAGLMLRVTAESNSPTLHILANPPSPGRNQQEGGARTAVGGNTDDWIPAPADLRNRPALTNGAPNFNVRNTPVNIPNGWVRITRIGNQFTGYRSFDGVNWAPFTTINLAAPATVLVGLAACAHNPAATNVANGPVTVATFSSFNVGIVQHVPTAVADTLGAVAGVETLVTVSKLLSNDSDQDGDSIAMTAVSSTSVRGGTVRFVTNNAIVSVSYRLNTNANFNVPDSFTYTIRDSAGLTSVGTVNVTITSPGAQTQNLISATPLAGGVVAVQFRGIIGVNYNIQAS
jgi:hypothetical protein